MDKLEEVDIRSHTSQLVDRRRRISRRMSKRCESRISEDKRKTTTPQQSEN